MNKQDIPLLSYEVLVRRLKEISGASDISEESLRRFERPIGDVRNQIQLTSCGHLSGFSWALKDEGYHVDVTLYTKHPGVKINVSLANYKKDNIKPEETARLALSGLVLLADKPHLVPTYAGHRVLRLV